MDEDLLALPYDAIIHIYYDWDENAFYDACGARKIMILDYITSGDLLLFRHKPTYHIFPCIENKRFLVEIICFDFY